MMMTRQALVTVLVVVLVATASRRRSRRQGGAAYRDGIAYRGRDGRQAPTDRDFSATYSTPMTRGDSPRHVEKPGALSGNRGRVSAGSMLNVLTHLFTIQGEMT